jgi:hypothetical protein
MCATGAARTPVRRHTGRETLHLPNSEGTTGPRAACDDAKAGHERGRQLRRPPERTTPAMAAKVTERLWEIGDIVGVLEAWEVAQVRRSIWEEGHGMV